MTRLDEKAIIRIFSSVLGIKDLDDVATLHIECGGYGRGRRKNKLLLVFKADMLVGSTDVPAQMKPWQAARKSIVSCASDLAAKGAAPVAAMVSVGLPAGVSKKYVQGLARGFAIASKEFGVRMVGGDTNEAPDLVIDCSMVGVVQGEEGGGGGSRMPTRAGARPGDAVVISGRFGYPACGLAVLLGGARRSAAGESFGRRAVRSVLEPRPRQRFGAALARFFTSSIDSSDGLAASLYELAAQSKVNIHVSYRKASAAGVDAFAQANGLDAHELVFHGGEEYEIVATIPQSRLRAASAAAKRAGVVLCVIGSVERGAAGGKVYCDGRPVDDRGYLHFSGPKKKRG